MPTKKPGKPQNARWMRELQKITPSLSGSDFLTFLPLIKGGCDPEWLLPKLKYLGGQIEHRKHSRDKTFRLNKKIFDPNLKACRAATQTLRGLLQALPAGLRPEPEDLPDDLVRALLTPCPDPPVSRSRASGRSLESCPN